MNVYLSNITILNCNLFLLVITGLQIEIFISALNDPFTIWASEIFNVLATFLIISTYDAASLAELIIGLVTISIKRIPTGL